MRKVLLTLVTIVVLAGLFVGSWFVTGMLRGETETSVPPLDTSTVDADATTDDTATAGDTGAVTTAAPVDVSFPLPDDLLEFERNLSTLMQQFGANSFAKTRVFTYASTAWYEVISPEGTPTFIAAKAAGQGPDQAMLAAGAVAEQLLDNPQITELIDAWEGELSAQTEAVVTEIVARADADGYDATAGAVAPTFDGEFGWKAGGTRDLVPGGYEPAYGQTRTIMLDLAACPVDAASVDALRVEQAALPPLDFDAAAPTIGEPARFSTVAFVYLNRSMAPNQKQQIFYQATNLAVALHDALIATWRANWENGVAAPIDIVAAGDAAALTSYPSYPSWTDVAASTTETYVSGIVGKKVTMDEMFDFLLEDHDSQPFKDQLALHRADLENAASPTFHWNADREAGRKLGTCIAGEALKALTK